MTDRIKLAELRESVDLENQSDVQAASGNIGDAARLMKQANEIRSRELGRGLDPNELRERTHAALRAGEGV